VGLKSFVYSNFRVISLFFLHRHRLIQRLSSSRNLGLPETAELCEPKPLSIWPI
jgi:hypothetical protein